MAKRRSMSTGRSLCVWVMRKPKKCWRRHFGRDLGLAFHFIVSEKPVEVGAVVSRAFLGQKLNDYRREKHCGNSNEHSCRRTTNFIKFKCAASNPMFSMYLSHRFFKLL